MRKSLSIGGAVRISKRKASSTEDSSGISAPASFDSKVQPEFEFHDEVFSNKRRSTLGSAARVKTPQKFQASFANVDNDEKSSSNLEADSCTYDNSTTKSIRCSTAKTSFESSVSRPSSRRQSDESTKSDHSESNMRLWRIEDFSIGKALGKGKFGNVYFARQKQTNAAVALKVLFKAPMIASDSVTLLRREIEIQCRLRHPNITKLYGYFQDNKTIYLLLQYLPQGELYKFLQKNDTYGRVVESTAWSYVTDAISALAHIHRRHVIHRDIKPENLLVDDAGRLHLADFGWAIHAPPPHERRYTVCGTPEYSAPEMVAEDTVGLRGSQGGYTKKVDLWAIGILMFELLFGRTPFKSYITGATVDCFMGPETAEPDTGSFVDQHLSTKRNILSHTGVLDFESNSLNPLTEVSAEAKEFMTVLLLPDYVSRPTAECALAMCVKVHNSKI